MPIIGSPEAGSFHVTETRRSASSLSIVMSPARWAAISGAGSRSAGRVVRLPGGGAGRQRKCRSAVARSKPLTYSMSVMRFAAKFTVRWRSARAEASQISGSGGPAPNGCGVLSKVGSSGRDGVAETLLIWRLLILIRGAQGALSGRRSQGAARTPQRPQSSSGCAGVVTHHSGSEKLERARAVILAPPSVEKEGAGYPRPYGARQPRASPA